MKILMRVKRLRWTTLALAILLGAVELTWEWLAYVRYCQSPPLAVSVVIQVVFFGLIGTSIWLSHKGKQGDPRVVVPGEGA